METHPSLLKSPKSPCKFQSLPPSTNSKCPRKQKQVVKFNQYSKHPPGYSIIIPTVKTILLRTPMNLHCRVWGISRRMIILPTIVNSKLKGLCSLSPSQGYQSYKLCQSFTKSSKQNMIFKIVTTPPTFDGPTTAIMMIYIYTYVYIFKL